MHCGVCFQLFSTQANRTLTSLDLAFNRLGGDGAAVISAALKVAAAVAWCQRYGHTQVNCTLTHINLASNNLGDFSAYLLGDALKVVQQ